MTEYVWVNQAGDRGNQLPYYICVSLGRERDVGFVANNIKNLYGTGWYIYTDSSKSSGNSRHAKKPNDSLKPL